MPRYRVALSALCLCLLALLSGCRSTSVRVELKIDDAPEGHPVRMVYYATDSHRGMVLERVAIISQERTRIKLPSLTPAMVWIYGTSTAPRLAFYAEPGDKITISGKGSDPADWHVSGGELNDRWEEWRATNARVLASDNAEKINAAVAKYVKGHTSEPFSTLLMLTTYRRYADEEGYRKLWKSLKPEALRQQLIDAIGRADQPDGNLLPTVECTRLTLNVTGDSIARLHTKDKHETLLYFWLNNTPNRRATLDSLSDLARSAGRRVVDICLENDSNSWLTSVGRDSTLHMIHAWAYGGVTNKEIARLEVPSTPYFILLDSKGHQKYRGTSIPPALRKEVQ